MTANQRLKRYVAVIMITVLILSSPIYVSAGDVSQNDDLDIKKLTANVETDIYQVVMPTDTEGIFDFILDPQRLINETDGALYGEKVFEKDCSVFFRRSDGKVKEDYSRNSDFVTITNKSTMPVEVSLEVKVNPASLKGIEMTEDSTFKKDKRASLYLAVVDGKEEVPVGKDGVTLHKTIEAAPDGAYGYCYDSVKEKYIYGLKKDADDTEFDKYSFQITGAANEKGDWTALGKATPEIVVIWKVIPKENTKLRKDAILKENKATDEIEDISEGQEESQKSEIHKASENKEAEKEENISNNSDIAEEDAPAVDENDNEDEGLNDMAE